MYGIFGVLTTLVNIFVYFILVRVFNFHYLISTIISWIISVLFAYFTNKKYVFESKGNNYLKEIFAFIGFRILSGIIEIVLMYLFVDTLTFDDLISKVITNIVVVLLNYIFSKLFVFKNKSCN
ncbi:MAG: GtrA family protein [Firmicutes bacterium]|nr:GtrA family protein [Bacillota bacterium]